MPKHSRKKRHLSLDEIGKCNPKARRGKAASCLPDDVYKHLTRRNHRCNGNEHCLLDFAYDMPKQQREKLRRDYLRPKYPSSWESDPDEWLDNFNIDEVMKQYQAACPWFRFIGVFPIDFSIRNPYSDDKSKCLYPEICNIDLKEEYKKGIRALGFVFNLDTHDKSGSHWVGLYCDIHNLHSKGGKGSTWCAYFDSYGYQTPAFISQLMRYFYKQDRKMKLMYNGRRFQYSNSECGMYSMYFIVCMMNGIHFKDFCKERVPDEIMLKLRTYMFRK
jgi:Ulp1 protease family, C-terminal catalytic domain